MTQDPFRLTSSSNTADKFRLSSRSKMRFGFNRLIDDHPHFLVYVRKLTKYPHGDCMLSDLNSPSPECSVCFGTGYQVQFEKHKCRRVLTAKSTQETLEPYGWASKYQSIIYTPRYYYPKTGDLYIEVEWDKDIDLIESSGKPINIIKLSRVDDVVAMSEDEVTFLAVGALPFNFNSAQLETWLLTIQRSWKDKVVV